MFHNVSVAGAVDCLVETWEAVRIWEFLGLRKELVSPSVRKGWKHILFSFVVPHCNSGCWSSPWSPCYIPSSLWASQYSHLMLPQASELISASSSICSLWGVRMHFSCSRRNLGSMWGDSSDQKRQPERPFLSVNQIMPLACFKPSNGCPMQLE